MFSNYDQIVYGCVPGDWPVLLLDIKEDYRRSYMNICQAMNMKNGTSPRNFPDWLSAYVQYAGFSEAPRRMHYWSGVAAIAGALRRRVWVDMGYFRWFPNFYIILVAPPGVVSKSTTASIAMNLLRRVPGVNFGPEVVTWQALVASFESSTEMFEIGGEHHTQSAITIESSELGNLLDPSNREQIDMLVNLWDCKVGAFKKVTKGSGVNVVENPFINLIACTTPAWIAGNFPEYVIGGGFTSRCLFVYADEKEKYIAYPSRHMPKEMAEVQTALVQDLEQIASQITGPYTLEAKAIEWGEAWYLDHWKHKPDELDDDRFSGYLARKQTAVHKAAMCIAASNRNEVVITREDLQDAVRAVGDLERDMVKVFARIGRTQTSVQAERFIRYVQKRGTVPYADAYKFIHTAFPSAKNFEDIVVGATKAGFITLQQQPGVGICLVAVKDSK